MNHQKSNNNMQGKDISPASTPRGNMHLLEGYTAKPSKEEDDKSPYYKSQAPTIDLPKGGGALKGIDEKFTVNAVNGTSSLNIPLPLTPGRSGFTPGLSLSYNSGSGNSEFGLGWSLSLPAIQRKTDKKLPEYNDAAESDTFLLAGAEDLVPLLKQQGSTWITDDYTSGEYTIKKYRPRIEGLFARIEFIRKAAEDGSWWRVTTKDNIVTYYGLTAAGRIADPEDSRRIFKWLPQLVVDNKGNVQQFEYQCEDLQQVPIAAHEHNRNNGRASFINRYLKKVKYGNLTPYVIADEEQYEPAALPSTSPGTYLMEAVFDYGDHGFDGDIQNPDNFDSDYPKRCRNNSQWPCRKDPFSDFHAGFEIRTYRRCRRVLMFHYFSELRDARGADNLTDKETLVRSLDFVYHHDSSADEYAEADFITKIIEKGYKRVSVLFPGPDAEETADDFYEDYYRRKAMPAMTFNYHGLQWGTELKSVSSENAENAPQGLTGPYQWVDLWGEGLPGILTEQGNAWLYKNNKGKGQFTPAMTVAPKPSVVGLGSALQWQDLDADGRRQVASQDPALPGYFELDDDQQWQSYRPFRQRINVDWNSSFTKLLDLDGDGRPDLLMTSDSIWTWYKNLGTDGYENGGECYTGFDEESGPRLVLNDQVQSIFLADMNGDGLTDIVRIKNGEVCYWPNLGYGRFGRKVTMTNAPIFDRLELFNPSFITLADISGTGAADIIYLGRNSCTAWINLAGNAWSAVYDINPLPGAEQYSKIAVMDFLGNGTASIVWSSPLPQHAHAPMRYIDLMDGIKPFLMESYSNGMGKTVSLSYRSSTGYYLDDKEKGMPWATRLPFPVQCVDEVVTTDIVSETSYTQSYCYHHGYYDHEEREFRGFGRVDTTDADVADVDETNTLDQLPVLTKTWYHTGAWMREKNLLDAFALEYYTHASWWDAPLHIELPSGLNAQELREAHRALKGLPLRQEVYAKDAGPKELLPYSVIAYAYSTKLVQPLQNNRHASLRSFQQQSVAWHCEREPADPRILQEITLETDRYGNVLQSAKVAYPRSSAVLASLALPEEVSCVQSKMLVTYTTAEYTNDINSGRNYRLRLPYQSGTYQLYSPDIPAGFWKGDALLSAFAAALEIDYSAVPTDASEKRLLSASRILYRGDDAATVLALGVVESLGLEHEKYQLAITGDVMDAYYGGRVTQAMLEDGGYRCETDIIKFNSDVTDRYWLAGGTVLYGVDPATALSAEIARETFYMPFWFKDPWDNLTEIQYWDDYYLVPEIITIGKHYLNASGSLQLVSPSLENTHMVNAYDWRCLQPSSITDQNDNTSEILFDTLCLPVAMALKGNGTEADFLTYLVGTTEVPLDPEPDGTTLTNFWNDPKANAAALLERATWRCIYDLNSTGPNDPVKVAMIAREKHWQEIDDSPLQIRITYTDGLGRVAMHKSQAPDVTQGSNTYERWIGSGKTVYNNKGKAVMQYEPYFILSDADQAGGFEYDPAEQASNAGVTPKIFYDPLGRVYRSELPDGSFSKTEWTAWKQVSYDNNDTVADSQWFIANSTATEPSDGARYLGMNDAATKAVVHNNTPTTAYLDTLARPFYTVQINKWYDSRTEETVVQNLETLLTLDITGNRLSVRDARGLTTLSYQYNQLSVGTGQTSMDSGQQYALADASGQPQYTWDADDREFRYEYDRLRRLVKKTVDDGAEKVLELLEYGETDPASTANNLRGQLRKHHDGAGVLNMERYDFKGNLLESTRVYTVDYETHPDWTSPPIVAMEDLPDYCTTQMVYDALNRPVTVTTPDTGQTNYSYEETGLLYSIAVAGIHGLSKQLISKIEYDAKGQRTKVQYQHDGGDVTTTTYKYDPYTFRVIKMCTTTDGTTFQQKLNYWYDPVGNITKKTDEAQQTVFFNNTIAKPEWNYTYDSLYRLIKAGGRQHQSSSNPEPSNYDDSWRVGKTHKADESKMVNYVQHYAYDLVGNMVCTRHCITGASSLNWTRDMDYVSGNGNRLLQSEVAGQMELYDYDARGNIIAGMPHILYCEYNAENRLEYVELQDGRRNYYQYDANGQRTRKVVVDDTTGTKQVRKYVGGWEVYVKEVASAITIKKETLHVMDDRTRVAMIESPIIPSGAGYTPVLRLQFGDHLNSASLELDVNGNVISYEEYYPYGSTSFQSVNSSISQKRYRYTGKERDEETGFYYHGARYYVPWLSRWCAVDPLQDEMPNWSSYCYGFDNPIVWKDSTGLKPDGNQQQITIQKGATLAGIAKDNHTTVESLLQANPQIKDPNKIVAGGKLNLPQASPGDSNVVQEQILKELIVIAEKNKPEAIELPKINVGFNRPTNSDRESSIGFDLISVRNDETAVPLDKVKPSNNGNTNATASDVTDKRPAVKNDVKNKALQFDINKAVETLNRNATERSRSQCARYVRLALEAGGFNTAGHPVPAKDYRQFLRGRLPEVSTKDYSPQKGDIVVIEAIGGHPYGHIAMWNGKQWISDFKQNTLYPGRHYREVKPNYVIFRPHK